MYLNNGRAFVQGIMPMIIAVIAGLAIAVFMGVIKLQEMSLGPSLEADGLEEEAAKQMFKGTNRLILRR